MLNALLSLTQFYGLPLAIFASRRGVYQEKIEAQFPMGRRLAAMLKGAEIPAVEVNTRDDLARVASELPKVYEQGLVQAFLMSPKVWENSECRPESSEFKVQSSECEAQNDRKETSLTPTLTRYDVIKALAPQLDNKAVVSNLGWPSKELYAIKDQPSNFYMLGSMGMVTPIGLGMALATKKEVVVIDGDGSLLMNPGTLATVASQQPKNLTIVAIDNGAYGSTGNQPTLASTCVDLEQVARGFGIRNTRKVATEEGINEAMKETGNGPSFIHVLAKPGNKDVPNIPVHHFEIKKQVMGFLKG